MAKSKVDSWGVFQYETDMFTTLFEVCRTRAHIYFIPAIRSAIVESLLLHVRVLCDILLSRDTRSDGITLEMLVPGFRPLGLDDLQRLYGRSDEENTPCWIINKMLAHATTVRMEFYDHAPWLSLLQPYLSAAIQEVRQRKLTSSPIP